MPAAPWLDLVVAPSYTGTAVRLEFDVAQRFNADRSTFGGVLLLPAELSQGFKGAPQMLAGTLRLTGEREGLTIPAQSMIINENAIRIPISDDQVARLEAKRSGAEPIFELSLRGTGIVDGVTVVLDSSHPVNLTIPLPRWLKALEGLGFGRRRLIELPPPPTREGALWEAASAQIQAAAGRLATSDSGAAMTEARIALQRTIGAVGTCVGLSPVKGAPLGPYADHIASILEGMHQKKSDDPFQTMADAVRLAKSCAGFASDPPHTGLSLAERVHAELALSIATTLYTYFVRTIK
jgi:hypothetical protein